MPRKILMLCARVSLTFVAVFAANDVFGANYNFYVTKQGTGTWSFEGTKNFTGGMAVQDGVLKFDSLDEAGVSSALGTATDQFIVSGELVAATEGCSSDSSSTTLLESGPLADSFVYGSELEARYRTMDESDTCSLRSDKAGFIISFR